RRGLGNRSRTHDDLHFVIEIGIADLDVEHETIELRLGKRVGSFLFDRILSCQDEERKVQRVGHPARCHLVLLHRLQKRSLCLRRRSIDFVGEQYICENRSLEKLELSSTAAGVFLKNIRSGDVGRHQVRRKLNSVEFQVQNFRQSADEQCLGQTRHADEQTVTFGKKRDQDLFNDFVLTDDYLTNLTDHRVALVGKFFYLRDFVLLNFSGLHPVSFSLGG